MSTPTDQLVHRPARTTAPVSTTETVPVQRPPQVDEAAGGGMGFLGLIPMLGAAGSMTVMMMFRNSPFAAVGALMMIVTVTGAVVMLFSQRGKAGRTRRLRRELYLDYLEAQRQQLLAEETTHRHHAQACDPAPQALFEVAADPHRLWERRRHHEDFLRIRLGTGDVPFRQIRLDGDVEAGQQPDPQMQREVQALLERFSTAPEMPLTLGLAPHHTVTVVGDAAFGSAVARALLVSAAVLHSPEDLHLAAAVPGAIEADWTWLGLFPHVLDQSRPTLRGPLNRVAPSMAELRDLLDDEIRARYQRFAEVRRNFLADRPALAQPRLLVFDLDGESEAVNLQLPDTALTSQDLSITVIHLVREQQQEPDEVSLRIIQSEQESGGFRVEDHQHDPLRPVVSTGVLDEAPIATVAGVARMLAPLRLSPDSLEHSDEASAERFTAQLGIRDFSQTDLQRLWQQRQQPDLLNVPIGLDERGRPVNLDLKESAQHGMGPHGLCVGATGSGKSELLRTLVLGLAATHPPETLNLVLVDYKGGATFAPFEGIPHVSGIITNLAEDASLVDRIYASLEGEVLRRQKVLKQAGNLANITEYRHHRAARAAQGENLAPLPHLFVVIDEFGELLSAQPDFIDLFMSIGRIGRSIGVHLLLSSQRIESGKLRGLDTHLSYRLGLRTLSEGESRTVLETPDAFHLPPLPGYGYLKVDTTTYSRFKAGFVSGPLSVETHQPEHDDDDPLPVLSDTLYAAQGQAQLTALEQHSPGAGTDSDNTADDATEPADGNAASTPADVTVEAPTVLSTMVDLMRAHERVTDAIWLPPLPDALTLDQAVHTVDPERSLPDPDAGSQADHLRVPIGLLDDPARQWQGLWELDLNRSGGNAAIIGGPSTGKTTALRTVALSLAATRSVHQVSLFGIDLKGSSLLALADLPHAAGMAGRTSRETMRRTVEEVSDLLDHRERLFEQHSIDTLSTLRRLHAEARQTRQNEASSPDDEARLDEVDVSDVVLLIDGWGGLLDEFEDIQEQVYSILTRGGSYGVHVVTTATRWNEVRIAQQSFFGTRLELRLGEPAESTHGRKTAERIPADRPGRGFHHNTLIGQIALPRIDAHSEVTTLNAGLSQAVASVLEQAPQRTAHRVRMLPTVVTPADVAGADPADATTPGQLPFGLIERDLTPKTLDFTGQERSLVVLGDELSGKSSLLRHLTASLVEQYSSDEIVLAVFDPRRSLQGLVPDNHLGGYATSPALAQQLSAAVAKELQGRVPSDPLAAQSAPAASTSTFDGPRIVLVADDYDVLTAGGRSPLMDFAEFLPMGTEIGLHALVARRVRGASRGLFEPFTAALRESGAATFMMDGDRSEGTLINGIRPQHQPPGRGLFIHGGRPPFTVQSITRETT